MVHINADRCISCGACVAIYCREVLGITDRLAFIGPCIGKKLETDEYGASPAHYNLTFLL